MVDDLISPSRIEPAYLLDEHAMLEGWLEFRRETPFLKGVSMYADFNGVVRWHSTGRDC